MELKITGTIATILDEVKGTSKNGKEWKKKDFVINTGDEYNPNVCFTTFGQKIEILKDLNEGDEVTVHFNVSSREYEGRYFHNINAWKIDFNGALTDSQPIKDEEDEDLPF